MSIGQKGYNTSGQCQEIEVHDEIGCLPGLANRQRPSERKWKQLVGLSVLQCGAVEHRISIINHEVSLVHKRPLPSIHYGAAVALSTTTPFRPAREQLSNRQQAQLCRRYPPVEKLIIEIR